jgi:RNA-directed DNA polymerase
MNLETPEKIRNLQKKLYDKAKREPDYRFYLLYDKICREDILHHAYLAARANAGSPGVDGESFARIESEGREKWLSDLRAELVSKNYRAQPVRRVMIPKPGGGERPLGIPTIRDRVVQTAAVLVLEPIFEADFEDGVHGYRPGRSGVGAVKEVHRLARLGYTDVVDADLSKYFDTIPHSDLLKSVARRIVDRHVLWLVKMWLKAPIEERDGDGKGRITGGKGNTRGTPQGGVVSPLLANIYMNRFLKYWRLTERGKAFCASIVSYADDFVILSRRYAAEALTWTRGVMTKLGLTLNEEKTSLKDARAEPFDFLGYRFGPHCFPGNGRWYQGASPSRKSVQRIKTKIGDILVSGNKDPWPEVRDRLNSLLRGWSNYFSYGNRNRAYQAVDLYVFDQVCAFLRERHKEQGRAVRRLAGGKLQEELGVMRLRCLLNGNQRGPCGEASRKAGCGKSARPV